MAATILVSNPSLTPIDNLMALLANVTTEHVHFNETKSIKGLNGVLSDSGTLDYKRGGGGTLIRRSSNPDGETLIIVGSRLVIMRAGAANKVIDLDMHPAIAALVDATRSILEGDIAQLSRSYQVLMSGTLERWRLTLKPITQSLGEFITQILVEGHNDFPYKVESYQANGDISVMMITR